MNPGMRSPSVSVLRRVMQNGFLDFDNTKSGSFTPSEANTSLSNTPISFLNNTSEVFPDQNDMNFAEKRFVWVPDDKEGYIAGQIIDEKDDGIVEINLVSGRTIETHIENTEKVNPPKFDKKEDMAELGYLNEASVIHNLKQRYSSGLIYTYSGPFLVAVNPYYNLPIYGPDIISAYKSKRRDELPPHIYSIADASYQALLHSRENQSILITGESGAGKTENTKKVIQYLTAVASPSTNQKNLGNSLEKQILSTNPILESFGNAQTIRNNNSSRFGKFIRIEFNLAGCISGANIEWYLLEKLRVTRQSENERNFHIFYQLLRGASSELKQRLLIEGDPKDYTFTKSSINPIPGIDDVRNFELLLSSLSSAQFSDSEINDIFKVVSGILNLGNIEFSPTRGDEAVLKDQLCAEKFCHVMGIPLAEFKKALLFPKIKAGRDWVTQSRNVEQVSYSVEALARSLYERTFGSIVQKINTSMNRTSELYSYIGVLDIAGFEILIDNSFEQLCINYTNERLQQFFNHHMFILEQEEYKREGIEWSFIDFGLDLQPTIDLIDKSSPIGVFACLDEESVMPKATDKSFTEKLNSLWSGKSSKYEKPRFNMGFIVNHYASQVEYSTNGWLEKNKDPINESVARLLAISSEGFVSGMFKDFLEDSEKSTLTSSSSGLKTIRKKSTFRTASQKHKEQLNFLMAQLNSTEPHFVRCIVPNKNKVAGTIDTPLVLDQLRCNGVLEGIRITRQGFPNREPFSEFRQRYEILAPDAIPKNTFIDSKRAVNMLLVEMAINPSEYRLGNSKVFFRAGVLAELEELRDIKLSRIITLFQALARGNLCRKRFIRRIQQAKSIRIIQRNARIVNQLCDWQWWKMYLKVKPLLHVTRADEELREKNNLINELKQKAEKEKAERDLAEKKLKEWDSRREELERAIMEERNSALDMEEMLNRTREREAGLSESLKENISKADVLSERVDNLTEIKEQLESKILELQNQLENESIANREISNTSISSQNQINALQKMVDEYKDRADTASSLHTETSKLVAELEEQIKSHKKIEDDLKSQIYSLNKDIESLKCQLDELYNKSNHLVDVIEEKDRVISDLENKMNEYISLADGESKLLEAEAEAHKNTKDEAQTYIEELNTTIKNLEYEKESLIDSLSHSQSEIENTKRDLENHYNQSSSHAERSEALEREINFLKESLQSSNTDLMKMRENDSNKVKELNEIMEGQKKEISMLKNLNDEYIKSLNEINDQMDEKANQEIEIDGIMGNLKMQLEATSNQLYEMESHINKKDNDIKELQDHISSLMQQLSDGESIINDLRNTIDQFHSENESRGIQSESNKKELELANTRINELSALLDEQDILRDKIQQQLTSQSLEVEDLRDQLRSRIEQHPIALEQARNLAREELNDLHEAYQEIEARALELEKERTELLNQIETLKNSLSEEKNKADQSNEQSKTFKEQYDSTTSTIQNLNNELSSLKSKIGELNETNSKLLSELEKHQKSTESLHESNNNLGRDLESLRSLVDESVKVKDDLSKSKQKAEDDLAEVKTQLEQEKNARIIAEQIKAKWEEQHDEFRNKVEVEVDAKLSAMEENKRLLMDEITDLESKLNFEALEKSEALLKVAKLTQELDSLREVAENSERMISDSNNNKINKLQDELRDLHIELGASKKSLDDYQALASRHERKANSLQELHDNLASENDSIKRRIKHLERRVEEITAEAAFHLDSRNKLETKNLVLQKEFNSTLNKLKEAQNRNQELENKLNESKNELFNERSIAQKIKSDKEMSAENILNLEEKIETLKSALFLAQRDAEEKQNQLGELDVSFGNIQGNLIEAERRISELQNERDEALIKVDKISQDLELEIEKSEQLISHEQVLVQSLDDLQKKLAEYKELADESESKLAKSERSLFEKNFKLEEFLSESNDAILSRNAAEAELKEASKKLIEIESQLKNSNTQILESQKVNERLLEEIREISMRHKLDNDDHDSTIDKLREKYQNEIESLSKELDSTNQNYLALREAYISLDTSFVSKTSEIDNLRIQNHDLDKELSLALSKLNELAPAYEKARDAAKSSESYIASINLELDSLKLRSEALESSHKELLSTKEKLEARLDDVQSKYVESSNARQIAEKAALQLEDELKSANNKFSEVSDMISNYEKRNKSLEAIVNDAHKALEKEREANTTLNKKNDQLERNLKESRHLIIDYESKLLQNNSREGKRFKEVDPDLPERALSEAKLSTSQQSIVNKLEKQISELQLQLEDEEKSKFRQNSEINRLSNKISLLENSLAEIESHAERISIEKRRIERSMEESKDLSSRLQKELDSLRPTSSAK
ncbi:Myosin-11 [Smittium mucronatum]|uniref:Myosin-11 n=1 Tax=Smittium mucronatum TaxID=133383 RepID=A0A1R0H328_9FUNG|nr:Myosin-11 [Smittium mucronatum]